MNPVDRPLRKEERELLDFLLSADFPGCDALKSQAETLRVEGECKCGCGTIGFVLPPETVAAQTEKSVPIEAYGELLDVLLFARGGKLSSLEIVFYTDPPEKPYPRPGQLKLWARPKSPAKANP
jgi:hypothetical protein